MTAQRHSPRRNVNHIRAGFTLIELMIVVTITGVLAAIAGPTFTGYIQKSRTSEAVSFLGVIKLRQEAYRAEFGSYLICPAGNITLPPASFYPGTTGTRINARTFPFNLGDAAATCFNQLGAGPDGTVRFGYGWAAGLPGNAAPAVLGLASPDHWFMAQAVTDLDGDGNVVTFELTSHTRSVWIGVGTATSAQGWE